MEAQTSVVVMEVARSVQNFTSGTALINVTADTTVNFSINPGDNNQNRILSYSLNVLATPAIVNNNL